MESVKFGLAIMSTQIYMRLIFILSFFLFACHSEKKQEVEQIDSTDSSYESDIPHAIPPPMEEIVDEYESPSRNLWQNPEAVLNKFNDLKGKKIADIGAGTGYFSFKMAERGAMVIAVDIEVQFLDYIQERKADIAYPYAQKVTTQKALPDDPQLPENSVDGILIVNTYPYLPERVSYLKKLKTSLQQPGKIVIVDFKPGEMPVGPREEFKILPETILAELRKAGFSQFMMDNTSLPYQYIIEVKY